MSPPEEEVKKCLEKLLSSERFSRSWSISRLLRFLVANALDGNSDRLKEYTLGLEVFDRGADFDPNADNIVRVQARNLRTKLEEYYAAEGSGDPIRIDFPKGGYLVHFRQIAPEAPIEPARPFPWKWIAAGVAAAAVIAVPFLWRLRTVPARYSGERHVIAVLPFTNLDHNAESDYFSDGLAEELINSLSKVQGLGVIARSSSFRFREGSRDLRQIARDLNATEVLEGSVRKRGSEIRVAVHLVDVSSSQTLWSGQYDRHLNDVLRTEEEIANGVSATFIGRATWKVPRQFWRNFMSSIQTFPMLPSGSAWSIRSAAIMPRRFASWKNPPSAHPAMPAITAFSGTRTGKRVKSIAPKRRWLHSSK